MPVKLSYTAKETYKQCPFKYKLKYKLNEQAEYISSSLIFGKLVDIGISNVLKNNDYFEDCLKYIKSVENENIKYLKSDIYKDTKEGFNEIKKIELSNLFSKGMKVLENFKLEILPKIKKVYSVQEKIEFYNNDGDTILGFCDFVLDFEGYETPIIFDFKTSSILYKKDSAANSDQLSLYYKALFEKYKTNLVGFIVVNKKTLKFEIIINKVNENKIESVMNEFYEILEFIEKEHFPKNLNSCYLYNQQCEFFSKCQKYT